MVLRIRKSFQREECIRKNITISADDRSPRRHVQGERWFMLEQVDWIYLEDVTEETMGGERARLGKHWRDKKSEIMLHFH